jgi:ketosteroid isomerase-like protein/predicted ester cyclase
MRTVSFAGASGSDPRPRVWNVHNAGLFVEGIMHKTLTTLSLLTAVSLCACEDEVVVVGQPNAPVPSASATASAKATGTTPADRATFISGCWSAFDDGDEKKMKACYADNFTHTDIDNLPPQELKGADALIERRKMIRVSFPNLKHHLGLIFVNGNDAVVVGSAQGKNTGELTGQPATNKDLGLIFGHILKTDDIGKAIKSAIYADQGSFAHQMGLLPPEAGDRHRDAWDAKAWGTTKVVVSSGDATEKKNLEAARRFHAAFNEHNIDKVIELYSDKVMFRYVPDKKDLEGKDAVKKGLEDYYKISSDVRAKTKWIWAAGDYVLSTSTVSGTNDGAFPDGGGEATNKKFTVEELEVLKMDTGRVSEQWLFQNSYKFAVQLGLALDPEAMAAKAKEDAEEASKDQPAEASAKPEAKDAPK